MKPVDRCRCSQCLKISLVIDCETINRSGISQVFMVLYVCRGWFVNQSLRQRILRPRKLVRLIASVWFRLSSKKLLKALYWLLHLKILSEFHEKRPRKNIGKTFIYFKHFASKEILRVANRPTPLPKLSFSSNTWS